MPEISIGHHDILAAQQSSNESWFMYSYSRRSKSDEEVKVLAKDANQACLVPISKICHEYKSLKEYLMTIIIDKDQPFAT